MNSPKTKRPSLEGMSLRALLILACLFSWVGAYELRVRVQPGRARGGEIFDSQPIVEIVEADGVTISTSFDGYATAQVKLGRSEVLWLQQDGFDPSPSALDTAAYFNNNMGQASFEGLLINGASEGVVLTFVAFNSAGVGVAWVDSSPFDITVGDAHHLAVVRPVGTVFGGREFDQVDVAVMDAGGNVVLAANTGTVTCSLLSYPLGASLYPSPVLATPIVNGLASFSGLAIDLAGDGYMLEFVVDMALPGGSSVVSEHFTVGVGTPASMIFLENPVDAPKIAAGEKLPIQPRIAVLDAGGNVLVSDSSSAVTVSILFNPSGALLGPEYKLFEVLSHGVATFGSLSISLEGRGYALRFNLLDYDGLSSVWRDTGLYLDTPGFDVSGGTPSGLHLAQRIDGAWAGGRGFRRQPYVTVTDGGGNIISTDVTTKITALVTPSMAVSHDIKIDTTAAQAVGITSLAASPSGVMAPGSLLTITVAFSAPIYITGGSSVGIELAAVNSTGDPIIAMRVSNSEALSPSDILIFSHRVALGDSLLYDTMELADYGALDRHLGGGALLDLLGRPADATLPSLGFSSANTTLLREPPQPVNVTVFALPSLSSDEVDNFGYGPGHTLHIAIAFSFPVVVIVGDAAAPPLLPLRIGEGQSELQVNATYLSGSSSDVLVFEHTISDGENGLVALAGDIILPSTRWLSWTAVPSLLAESELPTLSANTSLLGFLDQQYAVIANSTAPRVLEVTSLTPPGTYFAGDFITLEILWSSPVVADGDVRLNLITSGESSASSYAVLSAESGHLDLGGLSLNFTYLVQSGHTSPLLDFGTLDFGEVGHIWRKTTNPSLLADISLQGVPSLTSTATLVVDGMAPQVLNVSLADAWMGGGNATVGDAVGLKVTFDREIEVHGNPVLVLAIGPADSPREAVYLGGSGSAVIDFVYVVRAGDSSEQLGYRPFPNALCLRSGCAAENGSGPPSSITQVTTQGGPGQAASYILPLPDSYGALGVSPLGGTIIVDTSDAGATYVADITSSFEGTLGPGDEILISVKFSDEVLLSSYVKPPALGLNTGSHPAKLHSGLGTNTLMFSHTILVGDESVSVLDIVYEGSNGTAIICLPPSCGLVDRGGAAVNVSTESFSLAAQNISVNSTFIPSVLSVSSPKLPPPSEWEESPYGPGEEVFILVTYDAPIVVQGHPRLWLNAGNAASFVDIDNDVSLRFRYQVGPGDFAGNLSWANESALQANYPGAEAFIYRALSASSDSTFGVSSMQASVELPSSVPLASLPVDGVNEPRVVALSCPLGNGTFAPGDSIVIAVTYSRAVSVVGSPRLHLSVPSAEASYVSGSGSRTLLFEYKIRENDFSPRLELADNHAVEFGFVDGWISTPYEEVLRSSVFAAVHEGLRSYSVTLEANRVLPFRPADYGSLGQVCDISISGFRPFVTEIRATGSEQATYGAGESVWVEVHFSNDVVVEASPSGQFPSILLETGVIDREAAYVNGSGTDILLFEYTVRIGDASDDLDYWCDASDWRTSASSFRLNGSSIKRRSSSPLLDADIHLNPPQGFLTGTSTVTAFGGWGYYRDLFVRRAGKDYRAHFTAAPSPHNQSLETYGDFEVGFAVEFELMSADSSREDMFGSTVALDNDLIVVGAPQKHRERPEVQIVRTKCAGSASSPTREVQLIATSALHVPEIQAFSTFVDPRATVGGSWSLSYPGFGSTRDIPHDVSVDQLQTFLRQDIPEIGRVLVSRETNVYCSCQGGFHWTLTFDELEGEILPVEIDATGLTGQGASVTEVATVQESTTISGNFSLVATVPWDESPLHTRNLPHDASPSEIAIALEDDLGIPVEGVDLDCCDAQGGRKWEVTFGKMRNGDYNIPQLESDDSSLTGNGAQVWHLTGRDGAGPLTGTFQLRFRESSWTAPLGHNATASDVELALLDLDSIDECSVSRSELAGPGGQYEWRVTFFTVRKPTEFGFVSDDMGNLPPLEANGTELIGSGARVDISYVFGGGGGDYAPWEGKQMGDYGARAGAVYVFERVTVGGGGDAAEIEGEDWREVQKLLGSDTDGEDMFGAMVSVDVAAGLLIVGAPFAEDMGHFEQQSIYCNAVGGTFSLTFRGFRTPPIPHNISLPELREMIRGPFGTTISLHSLPELYVDYVPGEEESGWGTEGLCEGAQGHSVIITFVTPAHGFEGGPGNLEELVSDASDLIGSLTVSQVRAGSVNPDGPSSAGIQKGAAYVFRRDSETNFWTEEAKLVLPSGLGSDRYGHAVIVAGIGSSRSTPSAQSHYALVSAPGAAGEKGEVHVYIFADLTSSWRHHQTLTPQIWSDGQDQFGSSMDMNDGILVIGGPAYGNSAGAVFTWKLSAGGVFQADQIIHNPEDDGGAPGDMFGASVSLHNDVLVVGCPGRDDYWIHTGTQQSAERGTDTGAVYLFRRSTAAGDFVFDSKLLASNHKPFDELGVSVGVRNGLVIAGSHQRYEQGVLAYQRSVQIVTVQADSCCVGNTYRLGWKEHCGVGSDECAVRWTRPLETDADGVTFKNILEEDFGLGLGISELVIERSEMDQITGGYQYQIIFLEEEGEVPALQVDGERLTGPGARVSVEVQNAVPTQLRGVAHVFQREDPDDDASPWVEECFLYPFFKQRQDLFGSFVAVSDTHIAVGAPNRDTIRGSMENQNLTDINTGAVEMFTVDFLNFKFKRHTYETFEGDELPLEIVRRRSASELSRPAAFRVRTLDRNAEEDFQSYIAAVFDIVVAPPIVPLQLTAADVVGAGTAMARFQTYGETHDLSSGLSLWLDGIFDYRGLFDYAPVDLPVYFAPESEQVNVTLLTNDDHVVEAPDETIAATIYVPGMFPSVLGDLVTKITIIDNGDGEGHGSGNQDWGTIGATKEYVPFSDDAIYSSKHDALQSTESIDTDVSSGRTIIGGTGGVHLYRIELGTWAYEVSLEAPQSALPTSISLFGSSVAIHTSYGHGQLSAAVGAPGISSVYLYSYQNGTDAWVLDTEIGPSQWSSYTDGDSYFLPTAGRPEHRFGGKGSLSFGDDVIAVGAPGTDVVYIFNRLWNETASSFTWNTLPYNALRSPDADVDLILGVPHVHRQEFGAAVSMDNSGRSLAIGSPRADYDKLGGNLMDDFDTYPEGGANRARGRVYTFYRAAPAQTVTLSALAPPATGTFILSFEHRGQVANSTALSARASAVDVRLALESLENIDRVEVSSQTQRNAEGASVSQWNVTFVGEHLESPPLLRPLWFGAGCDGGCEPFDAPASPPGGPYLTVEAVRDNGMWEVQASLSPADGQSADRFGSVVALDGETLLVGAPQSSSLSSTSWGFETGDLSGWIATGDAFVSQPTYGDNSASRGLAYQPDVASNILLPDPPSIWRAGRTHAGSSGLVGRYYIGTYESRPGAGANNYTYPSADASAGAIQGDKPTGTLLSDVFTLGKGMMSFLVGGGCDDTAVYVELVVDGVSVMRATGRCLEKMRRVRWDVSSYAGRSARIRIVDRSSGTWGHINVDDFLFDWEVGRGGFVTSDVLDPYADDVKAHYGMGETTPKAGAAYIFLRQELGDSSGVMCAPGRDRLTCEWNEAIKLVPSDKRAGDGFGTSIALNDAEGLIAVGAERSSLTGFWREEPVFYTSHDPYGSSPFDSRTAAVALPTRPRYASLLRLLGAYGAPNESQDGSASPAIWNLAVGIEEGESAFAANAGAIYLYVRTKDYTAEETCSSEEGATPISGGWKTVEEFRMQAHDGAGADLYGSTVAILGSGQDGHAQIFAGARGSHAFSTKSGALYQADLGVSRVRFASSEFAIVEGSWDGLSRPPVSSDGYRLAIHLKRDKFAADTQGYLTVAVATSDITAQGVDSYTYEKCFSVPANQRGDLNCGDYEQTAALVTFLPGQDSAYMAIRVMDDHCQEPFPEYLQLAISIPGASALHGQGFVAKVRIDDDDPDKPLCDPPL